MSLDQIAMAWQPRILSVFRFITGLLLFQFGVAKILKFPAIPYFAQLTTLTTIAGILELVGGAMLIAGLATRSAAFVLSGLMACAYFIGHMFRGGSVIWHPLNNGGTSAILLCFACLYLAAAGPGPWSVDAAMRNRR